jgi:hypothetical protein
MAIGFVIGCQTPVASVDDLAALTTCRAAFERWVAGDAALNEEGTDIVAVIASQERIQRRVFELCGLAEAELLDDQVHPKRPPGIVERMIEPDMRTFAEVECVDEVPLLNGTKLCTEVGH